MDETEESGGEMEYGTNSERVIYEKKSPFQHITVMENVFLRERYLYSGRLIDLQGAVSLRSPEKLIVEYNRTAFVSLAFLNRIPQNVLFVGLGCGTMPRYFAKYYPETRVTVVEIDPDIFDVAKRFFYFKESVNTKVVLKDARDFIKCSRKRYDIVFLDAFRGGDIPFHLSTVEFMRAVKSRMRDDGILVSNVLSPSENKMFNSMIATHNEVFPHLYVFKVLNAGNFIFIATNSQTLKKKPDVVASAKKVRSVRKLDIDLASLSLNYRYSSTYAKEAPLLTDPAQ